MHAWARAAVTSAATVWVAVIVFGAVSIYGFEQYEMAWGRGASLQVYLWIASGVAFVSCFGAGVGYCVASKSGAAPGIWGSVLVGLIALVLSAAALALVTHETEIALLYVGASFFLVPAVVAYVACRLVRRGAARAV
jgi:hypothetical protein